MHFNLVKEKYYNKGKRAQTRSNKIVVIHSKLGHRVVWLLIAVSSTLK